MTTLSDVLAEALARHRGNLDLSGLTSLSDVAAFALSEHKGGELWLHGLTQISEAATKALAAHYYIHLPSTDAEIRAKHTGHLVVSGLASPSDSEAAKLVQYNDHLRLDDLTPISRETEHQDDQIAVQDGYTYVRFNY